MTVKICGVPEHFNHPWKMAIEKKMFQNINLQWKDVPEGTGKMCEMLRSNDTDIAIILTEGILKDIAQGNQSVIVQKYIKTPLVWGVHIPFNFNFSTIEDLKQQKIAISRLGSGSHLMSMLWAKKNNWNFQNNQYQIVNTIDGAVESLNKKESTIFMWEKFMTKPLVDANIFQRIEDFPTPWPCFVIAVNSIFLEKNEAIIKNILQTINNITANFKKTSNLSNIIANAYNLKKEDVEEWLKITEWSQENFNSKEFETIVQELKSVAIINQDLDYHSTIKKTQS